jgi:hypothetical protein
LRLAVFPLIKLGTVHAGVLLRNAEKNCSMVNTVIESRFPRSPDLIRLKKNLDLKFLKKCFLYMFISAQVLDGMDFAFFR